MPKSNICVIGLSNGFTDQVSKQLSIRLDMFYANVQQILEYELIDLMRIEEICGKEYLLKEEISIIRRICSYENTIINIEYANLNNETILNFVRENCLIIYLKLSDERFLEEQDKEELSANTKGLNLELLHERDAICTKISDIVLDCKENDIDDIIEDFIEKIVHYYP